MLGTRIDPQLLGEISGTGDRNVMLLLQAAIVAAFGLDELRGVLMSVGAGGGASTV